jgi:membrane-associated phospholipid phosphatase
LRWRPRSRSAARGLSCYIALAASACNVARLASQEPLDTAKPRGRSVPAAVVAPALLLVGAAVFDGQLHRFAVSHQTRALDRAANLVDPLGRARYILPALAGSYALTKLTRHDRVAAAVLRIAAGYLAADAVGGALKPGIGRRRPGAGGAWTFKPFGPADGRWRAFPSAHMVHATALAAGVAAEVRRPWVTAVGVGAAAIVGAQRVYTGAHWPSDVVAGGIIGVVAGGATVRWLRARVR